MVYASSPPLPPQINQPVQQVQPVWFNSDLLRAARSIYQAYLQTHSRQMRRPSGVVIHPRSQRGLLIFSARPILLPGECFIPLENIESQLS